MINIKDIMNEGECDKNVLSSCIREAQKVDFLEGDEKGMYAKALLDAAMWAKSLEKPKRKRGVHE